MEITQYLKKGIWLKNPYSMYFRIMHNHCTVIWLVVCILYIMLYTYGMMIKCKFISVLLLGEQKAEVPLQETAPNKKTNPTPSWGVHQQQGSFRLAHIGIHHRHLGVPASCHTSHWQVSTTAPCLSGLVIAYDLNKVSSPGVKHVFRLAEMLCPGDALRIEE